MVTPSASSAPRCAAESTPRANPLTTAMPRDARSAASVVATDNAYDDAAREPTIATDGWTNASSAPRVQRTGGGSMIAARLAGYVASLHVTGVRPDACARSTAA